MRWREPLWTLPEGHHPMRLPPSAKEEGAERSQKCQSAACAEKDRSICDPHAPWPFESGRTARWLQPMVWELLVVANQYAYEQFHRWTNVDKHTCRTTHNRVRLLRAPRTSKSCDSASDRVQSAPDQPKHEPSLANTTSSATTLLCTCFRTTTCRSTDPQPEILAIRSAILRASLLHHACS